MRRNKRFNDCTSSDWRMLEELPEPPMLHFAERRPTSARMHLELEKMQTMLRSLSR
jgi:hypothetical protein